MDRNRWRHYHGWTAWNECIWPKVNTMCEMNGLNEWRQLSSIVHIFSACSEYNAWKEWVGWINEMNVVDELNELAVHA